MTLPRKYLSEFIEFMLTHYGVVGTRCTKKMHQTSGQIARFVFHSNFIVIREIGTFKPGKSDVKWPKLISVWATVPEFRRTLEDDWNLHLIAKIGDESDE